MPVFEMAVVTQTLTITADTEEQAEEKYAAYFNEEPCPCGDSGGDCGCVELSDDVFHTTEKVSD